MPAALMRKNVFTEGIYKTADFISSTSNLYSVRNTSDKHYVYILIFDQKQVILQSILLAPGSLKFNLVPLKPEYKVVVVGDGEVYIAPEVPRR